MVAAIRYRYTTIYNVRVHNKSKTMCHFKLFWLFIIIIVPRTFIDYGMRVCVNRGVDDSDCVYIYKFLRKFHFRRVSHIHFVKLFFGNNFI